MEPNPGGERRGWLARLIAMLVGDGNRRNVKPNPEGNTNMLELTPNPDERIHGPNSFLDAVLVANPVSNDPLFKEEPIAVVWEIETPSPQDESKTTWPR